RPASCPKPLRRPASATLIFALASSRFHVPEQKGNRDEFWQKKLPCAQSASVQCASAAAAALARRKSAFPQSDAASYSKGHGCSFQSGFARGFVRCLLRRGARNCKTPLL